MTLLKRHLAPIDETVWEFIEEEAADIFKQRLNGRRVVDTIGPKGKDYAAYNTGRSLKLEVDDQDGLYSMRSVLPLVEVEVPFTIKKEEIEAYLHGAKDANIDNLIEAVKKFSRIENNTIYYGLNEAGIEGLINITGHNTIEVSDETGLITPITSAIQGLKRDGVAGPYNFVVGPYLYSLLNKLNEDGYPLKKKIKEIIHGDIIFAEELGDQGLLIATRDEDFEFVLGQDISIGYKQDDADKIEFFLTESFTFKANAPEAVVAFEKI